ncbi:hypothetical protein [Demequina salsinemoris]|uniref:hypothetical protein n=1 Tax=Demequina salsinemoris TaxID=577470 RepID=UPI00078200F5|nr:hypothetical protein [Demequina salsinemoris]
MPESAHTMPSDHHDAPASHSGNARTSYAILAAAAALAVTLGGSFLLWRLVSGDDTGTGSPAASASDAAACPAVASEVLELDGQVVEPDSPFCLVVTERTELTVGAAALEEGDDLALSLETTDGGILAQADTSLGADPTVTVVVEPGAYVGYVTALDGTDAPPFLVYTSTLEASDSDTTTTAVVTPTLADCGADVPLFTDEATLETDGDSPYLCLEVTEPTFLVAGAESHAELTPDEGGPDLTLAISAFDDDGVAQVLRSNDDVFGYDPEITIDLEPGTYLVSASSWFGTESGDMTLYAGPAGSIMRTGDVSTAIDGVTEAACDSATSIDVGDAITVEGEQEYVCLDNPTKQRLRIEAATLADQDLVLEVVQFVDGEAVRVGWSDTDPDDDTLTSTDPAIDRVLPEGTLLIAVTTFFDDDAADYDLRVVAED